MKRKSFLRGLGLVGAGTLLPKPTRAALLKPLDVPPPVCTLVPTETAGPYPLSLCGTSTYWRSDIREAQEGVDFTVVIKVNGTGNCGPMQNYRIDAWHCNPYGYYSGYTTNGQNGSQNNSSARWLRGIQTTNSNGEVTFLTKFPGWYSGRTIHIHFQIYSGGTSGSCSGWTLQKTSQFTFPIAEKNALLLSNTPYSQYGIDPTNPANDNVFSDGYDLQLATLEGSSAPYYSYYECAITGNGALPLTLLGFNAGIKGQGVLLWWRTTDELRFSHFELEYSPDGEDFEKIATIEGKGKLQSDINDYMYEDTDRLIYGNAFYRLKMVDWNGDIQYSSFVIVYNPNKTPVRLYPNPAKDYLIISHPESTGAEKIMIMDVLGREVGIGDLPSGTARTQVNLDNYEKGTYYLVYFDGETETQIVKFMID